MAWIVRLQKSSLGAKYIVALTGAGLFLFYVGHIAGNLLLFFGQDAFNTYAEGLKKLPFGLLWIARGGLLAIVLLHIIYAYRVTFQNRAARPQRYQYEATLQASFASRVMPITGTLILIFIIYHLLHFTFHAVNFTGHAQDPLGRHDVYKMVVEGFQNPVISGFYILSQLILGHHLSHGLSSMFQSLGLNHRKYNLFFRKAMPLVGWLVALAAVSIPVAVLVGYIQLP